MRRKLTSHEKRRRFHTCESGRQMCGPCLGFTILRPDTNRRVYKRSKAIVATFQKGKCSKSTQSKTRFRPPSPWACGPAQTLYKRNKHSRLPPLNLASGMSSYGQHAPSSSFQQDPALVARFASQVPVEREHCSLPATDVAEEFTVWNNTIPHESRPKKPTLGRPVHKEDTSTFANERTPLLSKPSISRINEAYEDCGGRSNHDLDYRRAFFEEVMTLARYTLPAFG